MRPDDSSLRIPGADRRLRLSNKRIQETVVDVSGGIEFLQAAGFQLAFEEDAQTGATEGCAQL